MQRLEVDRDEFERVREGLRDVVETISSWMTVIEGRDQNDDDAILIRQAGHFYVIRPKAGMQPDESVVSRDEDQQGGEFF